MIADSQALQSIAESLRRIADMMAADRADMEQARETEARFVDPYECSHPREHRIDVTQGAQLRRGCSLCGVDDISKTARAGVL